MNELICNVQRYAWGRKGSESRVALFKKSQSPDEFSIDENATYAELWMGTHANCPSEIKLGDKRMLLSEYLKPECARILGQKCMDEFFSAGDADAGPDVETSTLKRGDLPFLFKVLSINQALSIQAHPAKAHARLLHARDPKNYPDANHKPEMLVAISDGFEALCAFRPPEEIASHFVLYSELARLCGRENTDQFVRLAASDSVHRAELEQVLKSCFESLMNQSQEEITNSLEKHKSMIVKEKGDAKLEALFLRLSTEYPGDVGCFSIYLLNYMELRKGEAIFLGANIPHAYLRGDGVECMACSDNVVRAGLTPKFKDVNVLCSMLDYSMRTIEQTKLKPDELSSVAASSHLSTFRPNVNEFSVQQIRLGPNDEAVVEVPKLDTASILIVVENDFQDSYFLAGQSKLHARPGLVYFIDSQIQVFFHGLKGSSFLAYRAYVDIKS